MLLRLEGYISRRLLRGEKRNFSRPIVRVAVISVALGLACMIVSVAIVTGFQKAIRDKITGFGSHIQITYFDNNNSYEMQPITADPSRLSSISAVEGVKNVQVFATKAAIIKTDKDIEGVVFKGVGPDYDWSYFNSKIVEGKPVRFNTDTPSYKVLISKDLSDRLYLKTGDPLRMYFIQEGETVPRGRRCVISGIYETGLQEFDRLYVMGDIRIIRKLNEWADDQVGGIEVQVKNFDDLAQVAENVDATLGYEMNSMTIRDLYPQIFEWLDLMDMNVIIILVLMITVSAMTMISTILIMVLEKTSLIGILKALGARNPAIRKLFIVQGAYVLMKGMLWGNLIGISLCWIQSQWGFIKLPQDSYYVSMVPVNLEAVHLILLNAGALVICLLLMMLPSMAISRISPIRTIRYQ